jgi:hypothetical protein
MAIKVYVDADRRYWPNALAAIGPALVAGAVAGIHVYKWVDDQSIVPVLRAYITGINAKGVTGASVPVYKNIDPGRVPAVIRQVIAATNIIHP